MLAVVSFLFIAACSFQEPEPVPFTLDSLREDSGEYRFPGFSWNSSQESVTASVKGVETGGSSLDGSREYMTDQTYELNGFAASAELVFYHGKLGDICFSFAPGEGGKEWYAGLLRGLTDLYGEPESFQKPSSIQGAAASEKHRWTTEKTGLQLSGRTSGKTAYVELKLFSREVVKW